MKEEYAMKSAHTEIKAGTQMNAVLKIFFLRKPDGFSVLSTMLPS